MKKPVLGIVINLPQKEKKENIIKIINNLNKD
jgi:hypothetical protein